MRALLAAIFSFAVASAAFCRQPEFRPHSSADAISRCSTVGRPVAMTERARERQGAGQSRISTIVRVSVAPGSVTSALEPLRMARKLDPYRETARIALEPWLVEAPLARLHPTLSPADQWTIVKATRTPYKVRWPDWWSEHP